MGYARVGSNPAVVASHFWRSRAGIESQVYRWFRRDRTPRFGGRWDRIPSLAGVSGIESQVCRCLGGIESPVRRALKRDRIPWVFGVAGALLAEWSKALRSGRSLQSEAQVRILRSAVTILAYDRPHGSVGRALGC